METSKQNRPPSAAREPQRPEKKWGPFHGGIGVAVWLNSVDTEEGKRYYRSISIAPRRYRNKTTGEWEDSGSYRAADLASLILALQAANEYTRTTPLPGQAFGDDELVHAEPVQPAPTGDVPF